MVQAVVIGVDSANFTVNLSIKRFDQVQNRKVVAQYLKQAPLPDFRPAFAGFFSGIPSRKSDAEEEQDK